MKKINAVILWTSFAFSFLGVNPAGAQMSFLVSPIRVEQQVAAGASETDVIEVRNEGTKANRVKVYTEDWEMDRKGEVNYARAGKGPQLLRQLDPTQPHGFSGGTRPDPADPLYFNRAGGN